MAARPSDDLDRVEPLALRLAGVRKSFAGPTGPLLVLDGVDLEVAAGETVALVGPSGCGKSTILRLLAALEEPDAGDITVGGRAPEDVRRRHQLGVVLQQPALLPWRTVWRNVALPGQIQRGRPLDHDRVDELLRLVGLEGFERARPAQLSGGMQQRAAIARALLLHPLVLLLDEPFAALDEISRLELDQELVRISRAEAATTVLVTHSIQEAVLVSDTVVVLSHRPARVLAHVRVPLDGRRDVTTLGTSDFRACCEEIAAIASANWYSRVAVG